MYRALHTVELRHSGETLRLVAGELYDLAEVDQVGIEWMLGNGYVEPVRGEVEAPATPETGLAKPEKRAEKRHK